MISFIFLLFSKFNVFLIFRSQKEKLGVVRFKSSALSKKKKENAVENGNMI